MSSRVISTTEFKSLSLKGRGKVRDIYDLGESLLIVASDRISAFDVVMPNPIPDKGRILTQLSIYWFRQMEDHVENHLLATEIQDFPAPCQAYAKILEGRSIDVGAGQQSTHPAMLHQTAEVPDRGGSGPPLLHSARW